MQVQDLQHDDGTRLPRRWPDPMRAFRSRGITRLPYVSAISNRWLIVFIVVPLTVVAIPVQLSTYPNHDVAWVLWGTRELLRGAQWGHDIIEPNPPLAWYLSMPSSAVAMWLGVPLDWTFRISVALAAALSASCFAWLLRENNSRLRAGILSVVAAASVLLLPAREFGQREHLLTIALLPYLALASQRVGQKRISATVAVAIGLTAGLGLALKPYFLAVPVLVEIAVQLLSKRRVRLFRAENLALGSVFAVYAIVLLVFHQAYLTEIIPLAREIYWSFDRPWAELWPRLMRALLMAIPIAAYALYRRDVLGIILTAALCGLTASYIMQHKGYPYHLLPITITAFVLTAHFATTTRGGVRLSAYLALVGLLLIAIGPIVGWWRVNRPGGARSNEIERIRTSIDGHARNGRFLIVAVHPYPTFPVATYTPARYVSRTNSQWFLPAVVSLRTVDGDHERAASIELHAREFIQHDLAKQPDLVLIDTNSGRHTVYFRHFDFLSFYQEDPVFRRNWESYKEIERLGPYRQFIRAPQPKKRQS